jgi:serine/threonine protein kinase
MAEESGVRVLAGRYRLITPLGSRVTRGWDLHLRRVVAVRVLPSPDGSDQVVERAGRLADLTHPGLVRVLDAGNSEGDPFLVAEFVAATTLKARLADGPLPHETVGQMGVLLAKALAYAHSREVPHRDITPRNVLLGAGNEPYLAHVGITELPTPSYMAPEQVGDAEPSMAADVYALGLVLLESLTGKVEYPGNDAVAMRRRLAHPPVITDEVPYAQALRAMTATDPGDRPSAGECVDLFRGTTTRKRAQTRVVLVAALAAAVVATTVTLIVNSSDPQPPPSSPQEPVRHAAEQPVRTAPNVPYADHQGPLVTKVDPMLPPPRTTPPPRQVAVTSTDPTSTSTSTSTSTGTSAEAPPDTTEVTLFPSRRIPPGKVKKAIRAAAQASAHDDEDDEGY